MATLTVTTLFDTVANDGLVSLREALMAANGDITVDGATGSGVDTIDFDASLAGGTLGLSLGELTISAGSTVVINGDTSGDGRADITLSGLDTTRLFEMPNGADLTLKSLTLSNGYASDGGAVRVWGGATLTVISSTLANNATTGSSGAISAGGGVTLINSTLADNTAGSSGGAMRIGSSGAVLLVNTTLTGNTAAISGGAISIGVQGQLHAQSSTISGNHAGNGGGGVHVQLDGVVHLDNTIIAGNTATQQAGSDDTYGTGTLLAHGSILGTGTGGASLGAGSANNTFTDTPGIGALADNGGAVRTMAPLSGSAAINAGSDADLPTDTWDRDRDGTTAEVLPVDARGSARVVGRTDIGAVERANNAPAASAGSASLNEDGHHTFAVADFNFLDGDGDALQSVTIATLPAKGTLTLNGVAVAINEVVPTTAIASGLLRYTPVPNESSSNGSPYSSFGFTLSDGIDSSAASTFGLTVAAINDAPTISAPVSIAGTEDQPIAVTGLSFSDVDAGGGAVFSDSVGKLVSRGFSKLRAVHSRGV